MEVDVTVAESPMLPPPRGILLQAGASARLADGRGRPGLPRRLGERPVRENVAASHVASAATSNKDVPIRTMTAVVAPADC